MRLLLESQYKRLLTYLRHEDDCLIWTFTTSLQGYGYFLGELVHNLRRSRKVESSG